MLFISYATTDYLDRQGNVIPSSPVARVCQTLRETGVDYWVDKQHLKGGDRFPDEIARQIQECDAFIYISTAAANASDWTMNEIATAHMYGKRIIPIRFDQSEYRRDVMIYIAGIQYIDCTHDVERGLRQLVEAIKGEGSQHVSASKSVPKWKQLLRQYKWWITGAMTALILLGSGVGLYNAIRPSGPVVYVTESGKRYHVDDNCPSIKGRKIKTISLSEAEEKGLTPCKRCGK